MLTEFEYKQHLEMHSPQFALHVAESDIRIKATGIQQTVNVVRSLIPKDKLSDEIADYLNTIMQFAQEIKHIAGASALYDKSKTQTSSQ